jgi:hypothetical protein
MSCPHPPLPSFVFLFRKRVYYYDSEVNIVTGWMTGVRFQVPVGQKIFTSLYHPDSLWDPRFLLSNGYHRLFPWGVKAAGV